MSFPYLYLGDDQSAFIKGGGDIFPGHLCGDMVTGR